jgi:pimeloyl-ACP methyl ester carboxylesterase
MKPALIHGNGPRKAIVMNGWLGCARHWSGLLVAIDPQQFEIAMFDYRGYGARRDEPGRCDFQEAALDVLQLADALGWARFSLVGHSMGGMAMQRVALAAPARIERLLGIAPVPAAGSRMDAQRIALFEEAVGHVGARSRIVDFSTGRRLARAWCDRVAQDSWQEHRREAVGAYLREWALDGFADEAGRLALPVKVLIGAHDPSITADLVERTWRVQHPEAVVEVVENAGHYPMQETPIAVATSLQQWLAP